MGRFARYKSVAAMIPLRAWLAVEIARQRKGALAGFPLRSQVVMTHMSSGIELTSISCGHTAASTTIPPPPPGVAAALKP